MPVIESSVQSNSAASVQNHAAQSALLEEVRGIEERIRADAEAAKERFHKRGQLLPRERLATGHR